MRDLVVELVEKDLTARDMVDAQQRFESRPVVGASVAMTSPADKLINATLFELINQDDDERVRQVLQSRWIAFGHF